MDSLYMYAILNKKLMIRKASKVAQKSCREQLARFKVCSSESTCRIPTSFYTTVPLWCEKDAGVGLCIFTLTFVASLSCLHTFDMPSLYCLCIMCTVNTNIVYCQQ